MSLALSFLFILPALSRVYNVTIDDSLGDAITGEKPSYNGVDWRIRGVGSSPCEVCAADPDPDNAVNGTWHDQSTFVGNDPATITLRFTGTAVYVFCILINGVQNTFSTTRLAFYLDGSHTLSGAFLHKKNDSQAQYLYNRPVFSREDLTAGQHSLVIANRANSETGSIILFDYALYTTDNAHRPVPPRSGTSSTPTSSATDPETGSEHSPDTTTIVGGAVGGALATLLLLALAFRVRRARRKAARRSTTAHTLEPFAVQQERAHAYPPVPRGNEDRLLGELGWVREELQRVRQLAEPPGYEVSSSRDSSGVGSVVTDQQLSRTDKAARLK